MFIIFPYRIARPFKMPWVTIGIMLACTLVFVAQNLVGLERSYALLGFRPNAVGAVTWFTAMFAHASLFHLLGNFYFLWIFGGVLEDALGRARYLLLYLAGGLASALVNAAVLLAFSPTQSTIPTIGASGAIAAIMGVAAVRFYRLRLDVWYWYWLMLTMRSGTFGVPALVGVALYLVREIIGGVASLTLGSSGVANWAHVGGLVFGVAVAFAFGLAHDLDRESAEREAHGWMAVGRGDVAQERMLAAGGDEIEVSMLRAHQALGRTLPDVAAAGVDVRNVLRTLIQRRECGDAAAVYREFRPHTTSPLFLDAATMIAVGGACESIGDRETAGLAYSDLIRVHKSAPECEKALYRLSHVYLAQGQKAAAEQTWGLFTTHFPTSRWIPYADQRLAGTL